MPQLVADCLYEIFEYLKEDKVTLYSCLLVNRLWCEVSVRILWRNIRNISTLITCLPNKSKETLYENGISFPASKPPMFNYASFCKFLSMSQVNYNIEQLLKNDESDSSIINDKTHIIEQEIYKLLMSQTILIKLEMNGDQNIITFTSYPGVRYCLKELSELHCDSADIYPGFFYQLSQICQNMQSLYLTFKTFASSGLKALISAQRNLKCLELAQHSYCKGTTDIIASLGRLPDTLIKLNVCGRMHFYIPSSIIAKFTNLQEVKLSYYVNDVFDDFKNLHQTTFPQLQVLKFEFGCPRIESLVQFLENNGKHLKELYIKYNDNSLNLAIIKFCPNLRKLFSRIRINESETLKMIFKSCKYLESIKFCCYRTHLNEKDIFDIVMKYSPKNFHELKLRYSINTQSKLCPEELETFFIMWKNRIPQKTLTLINYGHGLNTIINMKMIKKYVNLGIIDFENRWYRFHDE